MIFSPIRLRQFRGALPIKFSYLIGAVISIGLPVMLAHAGQQRFFAVEEIRNSMVAAIVAFAAGAWLHRSLSSLPGVRIHAGILPSFSISFGGVALIILLARVEYSRAVLFGSMALTFLWFYAIYFIGQRKSQLRVALVEGGKASDLRSINRIHVRTLTIADDPIDCNVVAADLQHDHSAAWESRLADLVLAGYPVYHSKDLFETLTGRTNLEHLSENNLGALGPMPAFQIIKSVIDRLIAIPVSIVMAPALLVVALLVRLDSPGPAFFRQERAGYRGKPFHVIKFRTMRLSDDGEAGVRAQLITAVDDHRVTRFGRFLRRTRIDELPQIINILRGEMSWIGPRPEAMALSDWYVSELPFYRYRHVVVPGISGWAQVNQGHVAEIEAVREKLQFDFYYIRNFSFWLDLLIIARTLRTVITGFGHR